MFVQRLSVEEVFLDDEEKEWERGRFAVRCFQEETIVLEDYVGC